jgi:fructan beta-fructosidase
MTLAVLDRIHFYSSSNLKDWEKESEFGLDAGEHGGVWECPDLFPMEVDGKTIWALLVNLNPGGPNKGSATQYFLGQFDGKTFQPLSKQTKWLDYGPDEYAGVTWSNTGSRRLFIGWMSNWMYANVVPTETWRSACTIPRELKLLKVGNDYRIASVPVNELNNYSIGAFNKQYAKPNTSIQLGVNQGKVSFPFKVTFEMPEANDFSFVVSNEAGEKVIVGFDQRSNHFYIDRTNAGKKYFHQEFAARHVAPRLTKEKKLDLTLIVDVASIELFADQGLTTMTTIVFPSHPFDKASFTSTAGINQLKYIPLRMME